MNLYYSFKTTHPHTVSYHIQLKLVHMNNKEKIECEEINMHEHFNIYGIDNG